MTFFRGLLSSLALLAASLASWEALPNSRELLPVGQQAPSSYRAIGHVPNLYAAYVAPDGRIFGIEDHFLYVSEDQGRTFTQAGVLPKINPSWRDRITNVLARSKTARALRHNPGPNNLVVLSSGTILVFWGYIYRSTDNGQTFAPVFNFEDERVNPGFQYSEGLALGPDDTVYFGEYVTTARPHEVRILEGRQDGTSWKVAHTFPAGEIFHVHGIQYDPYRAGYWITTGDFDDEAKILFTKDGFRSFMTLGSGSQDWRAVSLMITKDRLLWGSDNDQEPAGIFEWNFGTSTLTKLQEIGKPSYYSTRLADGTFVLSTTYEPQSRYTKKYQPEAATDLWVSRNGFTWTKILSLPYKMEQEAWGLSRAAIAFPGGKATEQLLFTPISTVRDRFTTQFIDPRP